MVLLQKTSKSILYIMKIAFLYNSLAQFGGVERVISDKMNYLVNNGYDIYMITTDQGQHKHPYKLDPKIVFHDLGIRFHTQYRYKGLMRLWTALKLESKYRKKLKNYFITIQPDIIVGLSPMDLHAVIRHKGKIPLIVESHLMCDSSKFNEKTSFFIKLHRNYIRKAYCKADVLVALTEGDAKDWRKYTQNVIVIPNIVHLNNNNVYSDLTKKSVIFVGRLTTSKGIPYLLAIWEIVQQKHPDWSLDIYGEGPDINMLNNYIHSHQAKIVVHRPSPDILSCYKESSILVMTSYFESFGLVLPEAMSCGLPAIAFDCPYGPHDIIKDGVNGYLIECYNIEKFANRLNQLIESHDTRIKMGQEAIRSSQRYQVESIMPLWEKLYSDIYKRKHSI